MIRVIGAGLAGCEAAWQIAQAGLSVALYEMKPKSIPPPTMRILLRSWCAPIL